MQLLDYNNFSNNFEKYKNIKSNLIINPKCTLNSKFKYSIAIPTYKRPRLLIESIKSCIDQMYNKNDWQIIVVDNESDHGTETEMLLEQFSEVPNFYYYKNDQNIGMFGNWNRCFELAFGEYIVILSDDDLLKPNFLFEMDKIIKKNNSINMIYSSYDLLTKENNKSKSIKSKIINKLTKNKIRKITFFDFFLRNFSFSASSMLMKRALAIKLGGYDDKFFPSADYYFQSKFCKNFGNAFLVNKNLCTYRVDVNESMKYEVCNLVPDLHFQIRKEMMRYINFSNHFLIGFAVNGYKLDILLMSQQWGHDFSSKIEKNKNLFLKINKYSLFIILIINFYFQLRKIISFSNIDNAKEGLHNPCRSES